jgi:hypothetical protein
MNPNIINGKHMMMFVKRMLKNGRTGTLLSNGAERCWLSKDLLRRQRCLTVQNMLTDRQVMIFRVVNLRIL